VVGGVAKFEAEQVKLIKCPRRQGAYRVGGHPLSPCSGYGPIRNPAGLVTMLHVGHRYLAEQGVLGIDHRPAVAASLLPIFLPGTQPTLRRIRGVDWLAALVRHVWRRERPQHRLTIGHLPRPQD